MPSVNRMQPSDVYRRIKIMLIATLRLPAPRRLPRISLGGSTGGNCRYRVDHRVRIVEGDKGLGIRRLDQLSIAEASGQTSAQARSEAAVQLTPHHGDRRGELG